MSGPASPQLIDQLGLTDREPPSFLRSAEDLDKAPSPLPQAHAVRRAWRALDLCGVVYIDRAPTVYLKEVEAANDEDARRWHRCLWNHGVAPILVVADPRKVHVYSGWALPAGPDEEPGDENRLAKTLDRAADVLELQQLIHSVETGHFYSEYARCFDREMAVDRQLLHHLEALRKQLTTGQRALSGPDADTLLTRTIFVCYLIARDIICGAHFPGSELSSIEKEGGLQRLLGNRDPADAQSLLFELFGKLRDSFNGSLFHTDLAGEQQRIKRRHVAFLQKFLRGDDPGARGQLALGFPAYDFSIFLVSVFNRMAEEWRRKNPGIRNSTRAKALARILQEHLCGVDVSETACRIATFSLYLALLDQLEPRDIQELQRTGWRLPRILRLSGESATPPTGATVVQGNLFAPSLPVSMSSFDLVVGNPPWVGRGEPIDPVFAHWCTEHKELPVPENQTAHGFMWRAPDYLLPGGRGCLVLPAAVLLNKTSGDFQLKWFQRFSVERVTQLSDLSFVLFVGSDRPATVVRFKNEHPVLDDAVLTYETPKADPQSLRGGPVRVYELDSWRIRQSEVISRAAQENAPLVWKERLWGTPRDLRFLERLMDMPPLSDLVGEPGSGATKRWVKGMGFQPYNPLERDPHTGKKLKAIDAGWPKDHLFLDASGEFGLALLHSDTQPIGDRYHKLRRCPDKRIFSPPIVIVNQGFTKVAFGDFPVLFRDSLQSIAGHSDDASLLRFLAAVLDSDLALYFLFHTASSWGTERDKVRLFEILRRPFPLPDDTADPGKTIATRSHPAGPHARGCFQCAR